MFSHHLFWIGRIACAIGGAVAIHCVAALDGAEAGGGAAPAAGAPQVLTLADARRIAFANNWDLLAAQGNVDQALAQKIIAHEFPNPTFSFSTIQMSVDNFPVRTPRGNDYWGRNYDTVAAFNQLFEIGGKRPARQASAQAGYETARAQLLDTKRTLDAGVTKAYVAAVLAGTQVSILTESAASLRKEAEIAKIRLRAGDISRSDLDQIEIAADKFELDAKAAEAGAFNQRVALEVLLGAQRPSGKWTARDDLDALAQVPVTVPGPASIPNRPDLVAAEAALRKTRQDLRLQRAMRIPDPTFTAQYEHNPPSLDNTVGFGISLPLPIWNQNGGAIRAAEVARDQAERDVQRTRAQIVSDIASAGNAYDEASKRLRNYRELLRPKSRRIRDTVSLSYEKGQASLLDMLQAQRNDNDVRQAAAQAAADTAQTAADLKAATGEEWK